MADDDGDPGDGAVDHALDDAAPFLTWRAIYLIVLGALAGEILLFAALTARFLR
jgi:hypothetical protein